MAIQGTHTKTKILILISKPPLHAFLNEILCISKLSFKNAQQLKN